MSLIYGQTRDPHPDRLHLAKIGGTWIATFREGHTESLAREFRTSLSFELPYSGTMPAETVAQCVRHQNPGLLVIVDGPKA